MSQGSISAYKKKYPIGKCLLLVTPVTNRFYFSCIYSQPSVKTVLRGTENTTSLR